MNLFFTYIISKRPTTTEEDPMLNTNEIKGARLSNWFIWSNFKDKLKGIVVICPNIDLHVYLVYLANKFKYVQPTRTKYFHFSPQIVIQKYVMVSNFIESWRLIK